MLIAWVMLAAAEMMQGATAEEHIQHGFYTGNLHTRIGTGWAIWHEPNPMTDEGVYGVRSWAQEMEPPMPRYRVVVHPRAWIETRCTGKGYRDLGVQLELGFDRTPLVEPTEFTEPPYHRVKTLFRFDRGHPVTGYGRLDTIGGQRLILDAEAGGRNREIASRIELEGSYSLSEKQMTNNQEVLVGIDWEGGDVALYRFSLGGSATAHTVACDWLPRVHEAGECDSITKLTRAEDDSEWKIECRGGKAYGSPHGKQWTEKKQRNE